jgi:hypothetical protein
MAGLTLCYRVKLLRAGQGRASGDQALAPFLLLQPLVTPLTFGAMNLELTDEEAAALLRGLDGLIDGERYFLSPRIKTLRTIRAKLRPEPVREPMPPPPRRYEPPRATAAQRRRRGR